MAIFESFNQFNENQLNDLNDENTLDGKDLKDFRYYRASVEQLINFINRRITKNQQFNTSKPHYTRYQYPKPKTVYHKGGGRQDYSEYGFKNENYDNKQSEYGTLTYKSAFANYEEIKDLISTLYTYLGYIADFFEKGYEIDPEDVNILKKIKFSLAEVNNKLRQDKYGGESE